MTNVDKNGEVWPDSDANVLSELPKGSSTTGVTSGSLGDCPMSALEVGFSKEPVAADEDLYPCVNKFVRPESYRKESFLPV